MLQRAVNEVESQSGSEYNSELLDGPSAGTRGGGRISTQRTLLGASKFMVD